MKPSVLLMEPFPSASSARPRAFRFTMKKHPALCRLQDQVSNNNRRYPDRFLSLDSAAFSRHATGANGLAASGEGAVIDHATAPATAAGESSSAGQGRVLEDLGAAAAAAAGLRGRSGGVRGSAAAIHATEKRVEEVR